MQWLSEIPPPPNLLLWVGVSAFLFEVGRFLYGLHQRSSDREVSIVDDYWYRTILVPLCWQPIVKLVGDYAAKLHAIDANSGSVSVAKALSKLSRDFAVEKNQSIARFFVLTVFSEEVYLQIGDALDSLEDEIAEYAASVVAAKHPGTVVHTSFVESLFWSKLKEICGHMMKLHPQVRMPR